MIINFITTEHRYENDRANETYLCVAILSVELSNWISLALIRKNKKFTRHGLII